MKALIDRFASLRVTVTLLVLVLVALAAGTIVESLHGAEAALRSVYRAPWFYALLAVFAAEPRLLAGQPVAVGLAAASATRSPTSRCS